MDVSVPKRPPDLLSIPGDTVVDFLNHPITIATIHA
jgi:hypothetical protein